MVAPGPSEEAFPAAAAAEEAFLAEVRPSAAEEAAAAPLPCRAAGRTSLVLLRGRAPSLMLGACRARPAPSRAPAVFYSGGGGARAAARALRRRLRVCASRRFTGRPDHLSSRGAAGAALRSAASWHVGEGCGQSSVRDFGSEGAPARRGARIAVVVPAF